MKIDLNANFRSRREVLDGTNYIFSQIMGEDVGEIQYDEAASLKHQAPFPAQETPITVAALYKAEEVETDDPELQLQQELEKSQQEARYIIQQIQHLMASEQRVYDAYDKDEFGNAISRPMEYRDIVILMRSMTWSGDFVEEFKQAGIPLYAELSKGYFEALEVMIMLNTLRVVDNPYQDIPLASVLRAPFIGLSENELAKIRLANKKAPFFDALKQFVREEANGLELKTAEKLQRFLLQLEDWRDLARRGSLADLIWRIYLDTNYYEMVGAMANGKQRQANLRALHDRSISYEKTSFRGLFRFLRFIDRMRLRGDDLGTARAVSQSENVVRLMTIHSSKGLEFPYVFTAGMGRQFNRMDFNLPYLFDPKFGLAVKMIDPEKRIQYTSLPFLAMKEKKMLEMKAEEMRVLYVAMTRAKEKLYLVGSIKQLETTMEKWETSQMLAFDEMLPSYLRANAKSYLEWIGPALVRHTDYVQREEIRESRTYRPDEAARFDIQFVEVSGFIQNETEVAAVEETSIQADPLLLAHVQKRFDTKYAFEKSVTKRSKTSVSELKRLQQLEAFETPEIFTNHQQTQQRVAKRPAFLQQQRLTAAEVGTAMHTVMQHAPQQGFTSVVEVKAFVENLVARQLLTTEEGAAVHWQKIVDFFASPIGEQFKNAQTLHRELPFTISKKDEDGDSQILQGVIDCIIHTADHRYILLDYKTDRLQPHMQTVEGAQKEFEKRYAIQLDLYKEAIETILKVDIAHKIIYSFEANSAIELR